MNEELIMEDLSDNEEDISNNTDISLNEKLDRIEALLNEDISLRENDALVVTETSSGAMETSSGAQEPNYSQYIYDLLTDSNIKVEVVQPTPIPIQERKINEYGTNELIFLCLVVGCLFALFIGCIKISITNYRK